MCPGLSWIDEKTLNIYLVDSHTIILKIGYDLDLHGNLLRESCKQKMHKGHMWWKKQDVTGFTRLSCRGFLWGLPAAGGLTSNNLSGANHGGPHCLAGDLLLVSFPLRILGIPCNPTESHRIPNYFPLWFHQRLYRWFFSTMHWVTWVTSQWLGSKVTLC